MSEEKNATVDMSQGITPGRDESIDISSLIKASKETPPAPVVEKTPLQMMKEEKEARVMGMVVDNKELEEKNTPKGVTSKAESDAEAEVKAYLAEQDKMIEAAKSIAITDAPTNDLEMAEMMDNVAEYAETGKVTSTEARIAPTAGIDPETGEEIPAARFNPFMDEPEPAPPKELSEEDKEIIKVLVDKTGLGGDFAFTEEEREKIKNARKIVLTEVENVDLSSIKIKKAQKSFVESVKEFEFSGVKAPMIFPASRFKADMCGMTYGEMGDILVSGDETITFEQMRKRLTVIYNKMKNPSCGEFKDFDDFLKKFSYLDIELALYGIILATYPEIDDISMVCQNPRCRKSFNHRFKPASLLRFDKTNSKFIKTMDELVNAKPSDYIALFNDSPTMNHRLYKLPYSGTMVEIGMPSAYEYLYDVIQNGVFMDKFVENHPGDLNGLLANVSGLVLLVRSVLIPEGDGYVQYDDFEDVIQALYRTKPEDINLLSNILNKQVEAYQSVFELHDVKCPHCSSVSPIVNLQVSELIFFKLRGAMNAEVDTNNISVL